jgi:hypothetical protein
MIYLVLKAVGIGLAIALMCYLQVLRYRWISAKKDEKSEIQTLFNREK